MHLASDYVHLCKSAGGPARCRRVRIYCQTTWETTSPPTGVILAWKVIPSRSWSISSLRLRRVVPEPIGEDNHEEAVSTNVIMAK
jgi:hypothetical protein